AQVPEGEHLKVMYVTLVPRGNETLCLLPYFRHPSVIYMSHLACVDVLFTLLLPLKIHYHLNASDWVFGEAACRVLSAAYYCYMYCSILLMMSMSVDRLLAVVFPIASLTWRSTRKATSTCVCVLVWLLALDVGVPCHDVLYHTQVYAYLFSILSCLYFLLPLIITIVSYSTIIYVLTTKNDHLATSYPDKRRRAAIMAIAVLMEFVMCFAPTNGILLYHCVRLATGGSSEEGKYYLVAVCLGSASVFLDPLLYYYGSSQCRDLYLKNEGVDNGGGLSRKRNRLIKSLFLFSCLFLFVKLQLNH
uniref:Coagulation factor II thrombin receptor n=1 Tax=Sinocyclocheilus grahami TaxID=75366 RepID=A0A672PB63_SINGR